jgi:hypothetical protein
MSAGAPPALGVPSSGVRPPSSVGPTLIDSPHHPSATVSEAPPAVAHPAKKSRRKLVVAIVIVVASALGVAIGVGIALTRGDPTDDTSPAASASAKATSSAAPVRLPLGDGGMRPIKPRPKR